MIRGKWAIALVALALTAFLPLTAHAQAARTGVVDGQINDSSGVPLPGATVTLSSPTMIGGDRTTNAGADGRFRFPALPPGTYALAVTLQGFDSQQQEAITVNAGVTRTVVFSLTIGATETVTVQASEPLVDTRSAGVANVSITEQFAQALPSGRSAAGLVDFVPGVIGDEGTGEDGRGSSAFGGTIQGTQYSFDGVTMNSPEGGEVEVRVDFDNVAEATFTGVGGAAEVGGYSSAVFNIMTKSGSNELHGAANFFYRGDSWNSQNSDDPEFRRDVDNNRNWHVDLGGPLVPDRLWAYGSFRREVSNEATELSGGFDGFDKDNQFLVKLTYQINPDNKLSGSWNWEQNRAQQAANQFTAPEATLDPFGNFNVFNLDYLGVISENTFIDVKFGGTNSSFGDFSNSQDAVAAHFIADQDLLTESPGFFFDGFRNRYQVNVALSHYADDFLAGTHDIKVGFQGDWAQPRTFVGYTGECCGGAAYYFDESEGEPLYRYEFQSLDIDPLGRTLSFFLQDTWTINDGRVTIMPGVRFNNWNGNAKARVGAITGFDASVQDLGDHFKPSNGIAPRIGVVADLLGDGTTALKAHWGRYYPQMIAGMYGGFQSFSAVEFQFSEWNGDEYEVLETAFAPAGLPIDPDIKMTNFTEFSIGVERQITSDVSFEVNAVIRDTNDFMDKVRLNGEWEPIIVQDAAGDDYLVYDLLNPDEAVFIYTNPAKLDPGLIPNPPGQDPFEQTRDYWSLDFIVEKRFSNNWQLMASYVYSETTGTDDTDFENGRGSSLGPSDLWSDPNVRFFADGPMFTDTPHQIKIAGSVILPYEVNFGWFINSKSGRSWTKVVQFRDVGPFGSISRFTEPRGSNRLDWYNNLDLRAEKAFTFNNDMRIAVLFDIFNLFNDDGVMEVNTEEDEFSDLGPGRPLELRRPRRYRLGFRFDF